MSTLMKVKEVAERLNVAPKTVYRLIKFNELEAVNIGSAVRVSEEALNEYLNNQKRKVA